MTKITTVLACIVLLSSCASYQAINQPSPSSVTKDSVNTIELSANNVTVYLRPIQTADNAEKYYSRNLLKENVLPVQFFVKNLNPDNEISFLTNNIVLVNEDNQRYSPLSVHDVIDRAKFSQGQTAAWAIGFGIIGGVASAMNVSKANKALTEDYSNKLLKDSSIKPVENISGTLFYNIEESVEVLDANAIEFTYESPVPTPVNALQGEHNADVSAEAKTINPEENQSAESAEETNEIELQAPQASEEKIQTTLKFELKGELDRKSKKTKEKEADSASLNNEV